MTRAFDWGTAPQAMSVPGIDPRQWVSFATVDQETDSQKSVEFTDEYGPLVSVTLRPSGTPARCRVAHEVAGNGEGEWFPFIGGDEVIVLVPEGDETAGCTIVGRLNQEIDAWPKQVAGMDSTANNFAFRRLRTPYVIETAASYLIRSATTGAFMGISQTGALTFSNADNAFLALGADLLGMQNADGDVLLQIDVGAKQIVLEAAGTKMVLDAAASSLYTTGTLALGTSGNQASEHATSVESVLVLLEALLTAIGSTMPGPLTGAGLAAAAIPLVGAAVTAAAALPLDPAVVLPALTAALAVPKVPGATPGVAAPGLLI
jgi:hypothetical protein